MCCISRHNEFFPRKGEKCLFEDLSNPMPSCALITLTELQEARMTEEGLTDLCKKENKQCIWQCSFVRQCLRPFRNCTQRNVAHKRCWNAKIHVCKSWVLDFSDQVKETWQRNVWWLTPLHCYGWSETKWTWFSTNVRTKWYNRWYKDVRFGKGW